jgi:hypothetical protein
MKRDESRGDHNWIEGMSRWRLPHIRKVSDKFESDDGPDSLVLLEVGARMESVWRSM